MKSIDPEIQIALRIDKYYPGSWCYAPLCISRFVTCIFQGRSIVTQYALINTSLHLW